MITPLAARRGLITSLARGIQRESDVSWWLAGGVPTANCIAAYQPRGAASLAASYSNLSNPGTYDLTAPAGDPAWNIEDGWVFPSNNSAIYLSTGIIMGFGTWSVIVRFSNGLTSDNSALYGHISASSRHYIQYGSEGKRNYINGGTTVAGKAPNVTTGVMAVAGNKAYYNGIDENLTVTTNGTGTPYDVFIGALHRSTNANFTRAYIQAIAFYDTVLTPEQITAITDAINDIPAYSVAVDGVWSWFTNPTAVYYNNNMYFVPIDTQAQKLFSHQYNSLNDLHTSCRLVSNFSNDDHGNGSILIRDSDKKVLVFASKHSDTTIRKWVSCNPESVNSFNVEESLDAQLGGTNYDYPNPVQLTGEANDPIYLFYRHYNTGWDGHYFSKSTDGGATWTTGTQFFKNGTERPYFQITENGTDRIDFTCTNGHPSEVSGCSIYHFYYTGGKWYKSDGTEITDALPLEPSDVTQVYDGSSIEAWVWDIAINSSGNPVIVFATFPTPESDHRYYYAVWTGTSWSVNQICTAGGPLYATETYYSGGATLDKGDPSTVWCSRNIDSKWSIWKYVTDDGGANWTASEESTPTADPQARPYCAKGATGLDPIWWYGTYTAYNNNDCAVRYKD